MQPQNIPRTLTDRPQWVAWRFEQMPGEPKPRKVPLNPRTGQRASVDDPATWGTFEQACAATGAMGIGYVLSGQDRFACIDLDGCIGPGDVLSPLALEGALHFFGHVHANWRGSSNAVNVGVDVWDYAPVSAREAAARARSLPPNRHWQDAEPRAKAR